VEDTQSDLGIFVGHSVNRARGNYRNGERLCRRHPNVLILTTSNITGVIDVAFLDRADIRQYIGLPSAGAVYQILHSCIVELIRVSM